MPLALQTFTQLVQNQVSAVTAQSTSLLDFNQGSVILSLIEANAGNSLWIQGLVVGLLATTRLTTSTGIAVDTFVQDFGLMREPATQSVGDVVFSRATATTLGIIPLGSVVFAPQYNVQFQVQENDSDPYWNPDEKQYQIPVSVTNSNSIPVKSVTAGLITNVPANAINTLQSIFIGVDYVNNASPTVSGTDQESDAALKIRFVNYLNGLSKATEQALAAAILSVPGVIRYNLTENLATDYVTQQLGFFIAVIDDGTGSPSSNLISDVSSVVNMTRGLTIAYTVIAPTIVNLTIVAHVHTPVNNTVPNDTVQTEVVNALTNYINALPLLYPNSFSYTKLIEIMYNADPTITNVTNYTLNGGSSDLVPANPSIVYIISSITIDVVNP